MRRLSFGTVAALALLAVTAAVALAASTRHTGSLRANDDAKVRFTVVEDDGVATAIKRVRIRKIPYRCSDGGDGLLDGELANTPVEDRKFLSKGPVEGRNIARGRVRIEGRVRRRGNVASGTLRVRFRFEGGPRCRTGERRWRTEAKTS